MTDHQPPTLGDFAEQLLSYFDGEAEEPRVEGLLPSDRPGAQIVGATLTLTWHLHDLEPAPLEVDPVAISLGLVADPARPLDGTALRQARQRKGLSVSALASRLRERAWETRTADVYNWERNPAAAVPLAVIAALADELSVPERQLVGRGATTPPAIESVLTTDRFRGLARRWAAAVGLGDEARGRDSLRQLMLAGAVRRGEELDQDGWLVALEALVETREGHAPR